MGPLDRAAARLLAAPRAGPGEARLGPALDALGGEVVRLRSRDGLRLAGRWLDAEVPASGVDGQTVPASTARWHGVDPGVEPAAEVEAPGGAGPEGAHWGSEPWRPDPHEAIVLLHGYTGSVAPDVVEYGPFLRRIAGVLGLDFRGHGGSDPGPTTFGLLEVEDVAGALAWLGERGITRVALFGTSMGAITAIESVAILGDGSLAQADIDPFRPRNPPPAPRPIIVAVVADSATPELAIPVGSRIRLPLVGRFFADRVFSAAAKRLGADPRATEPGRVVTMVAPTPLLLVHGEADRTTPVEAARRLAHLAGEACQLWTVPGADHSSAHAVDPVVYERRVSAFLRGAFAGARGAPPIIPGEGDSRPAEAGV